MNRTVFILDDDAAVRRALAAILEGEGFTVSPFESAEAFLNTMDEIDHEEPYPPEAA